MLVSLATLLFFYTISLFFRQLLFLLLVLLDENTPWYLFASFDRINLYWRNLFISRSISHFLLVHLTLYFVTWQRLLLIWNLIFLCNHLFLNSSRNEPFIWRFSSNLCHYLCSFKRDSTSPGRDAKRPSFI